MIKISKIIKVIKIIRILKIIKIINIFSNQFIINEQNNCYARCLMRPCRACFCVVLNTLGIWFSAIQSPILMLSMALAAAMG